MSEQILYHKTIKRFLPVAEGSQPEPVKITWFRAPSHGYLTGINNYLNTEVVLGATFGHLWMNTTAVTFVKRNGGGDINVAWRQETAVDDLPSQLIEPITGEIQILWYWHRLWGGGTASTDLGHNDIIDRLKESNRLPLYKTSIMEEGDELLTWYYHYPDNPSYAGTHETVTSIRFLWSETGPPPTFISSLNSDSEKPTPKRFAYLK